ncbi:MAG TPA: hypothetical protein VFV68_16125 [Agriterribacter sp.]|nr:hypothetical protein [Agriterribacter sp.]
MLLPSYFKMPPDHHRYSLQRISNVVSQSHETVTAIAAPVPNSYIFQRSSGQRLAVIQYLVAPGKF